MPAIQPDLSKKSMNELISIIIVSYNGKKWLSKCLDSLFAQTYSNFEIIFFDNGSSDGGVEMIEHNYHDARLKIFKNNKNLGFAGGNNEAIKNSSGKYLLLLNTDAWLDNDFLDKTLKFNLDHNYDVLAPREAKYDGQRPGYYISQIDPWGHPVYLFGDKYQGQPSFYLTGVCLFFSKHLYEETGGLDSDFFMYNEEVDWCWRLRLLGKHIAYMDNIFIYHAGAGSSGPGVAYNIFLWRNSNTLQMLLKNYSFLNLIWALPIYGLQNIGEILFFLVWGKPKIALSYIQGWWFNLINVQQIIKKRRLIQKNRRINDREIIKNMYWGFGKFQHLLDYLVDK
jgi:GT2 family glycosyltransferase